MEMEHWCEFAVLARFKSYTKTAEAMNLSQSALSKHILSLERDLGVSLLTRSSRKVELSEAGLRFLPLAEAVQQHYAEMRRLARELEMGGGVDLTIGSIPVMAQYGIIDQIAAFGRKYPQAKAMVLECESRDILTNLRLGLYDMAFVRGQGPGPFEYKPLRNDRLVAVLSASHPLAGLGELELGRLKDEPLILLDGETSLYDMCVNLCREAGFEPTIAYTGRRPENLMEMASSALGVALVMQGHSRYQSPYSTVMIPITPAIQSQVCLARVKDAPHSKYARLFWDELEPVDAGE